MSKNRSLMRFIMLGVAIIAILAFSITAETRWAGNVLGSVWDLIGTTSAASTSESLTKGPDLPYPKGDDALATPNSTNGKIVFHRGIVAPQTIYIVDPAVPGGETALGPGAFPVWKPDASVILFTVPETGELKLMNPNGSNVRSLATPAFASASVENAAWSSDGTKIAFVKAGDIWIMNADGSGQTQLTKSTHDDSSPTWSPFGTKIAYQKGNFAAQIYTVTTTNPVETNLTNVPGFNNRAPNWSPNDLYIAIESDRDTGFFQRPDIYVISSQTGAMVRRVTNDNYDDHDPVFSPDGAQIVWQSGSRPGVSNNKLFVMPSEANPATAAQQTLITSGTTMDLNPSWGRADGCSFTLTPTSRTIGASGGQVSIDVRVSNQSCYWRAVVSATGNPFVHNTDPQGSGAIGDKILTYSVDPNSGGGRRSQITFSFCCGSQGGTTPVVFDIIQPDSQNCYYSISPYFKVQNSSSGQITITAPPGCQWAATTANSWIQLQQPTSGTGNGLVNYSIVLGLDEAVAGANGYVTIAGQTSHIQVNGAICPATRAARDQGVVDSLHTFRDEVLRPSGRGQQYIEDYYQFAGEISRLMIFNPGLFARSVEALARYKTFVDSVVRRERARQKSGQGVASDEDRAAMEQVLFTDAEIEDVDEILAGFSALGSEALRKKLEDVRRDIRDTSIHAEFGVAIRPGQRRAIPEGALSSVAGRILPAALFSGSSFNPFTQVASQIEVPERQPGSALDAKMVASSHVALPLSFEANRGQLDRDVKFVTRGLGYDLYFTPSKAVVSLPIRTREDFSTDQDVLPPSVLGRQAAIEHQKIELKLDGADHDASVVGLDKMPNKSNYFIGSDAARWKRDIPNFSRVRYEQVYPGIDLEYYGDQRRLEYDFRVAAGADPSAIGLDVAGLDAVEIDKAGSLVMHSKAGSIQMLAPLTYQVIGGVRREVASRYVLRDGNSGAGTARSVPLVGFEIGEYDRREPLVIDPVLVYSTYLGGSGQDLANSVVVDAAGNSYLIGFTDSTNFPVSGAIQSTNGGGPHDVVVSKINPSGTGLVYSTYIGGSGQDQGSDIAIDAGGNAYISGWTGSANFPTTSGAMQRTRTGLYNAFVAKLNPTGSSLAYSTYFGGTTGEFGSSIAIDASGNAFVGGVTSSANMPTLNPFQAAYGGDLADAYVAKINATGTALVYATYLGGNGNDGITDIAIDSSGSVYATGVTYSTNYPTKTTQQIEFRGGAFDAFVSKLDPTGNTVSYSTYIGGSNDDRGHRVRVDSAGNAYVIGQTSSTNFPMISALQATYGGGKNDAFLTKVGPTGTILTSTYLGGGGDDGATGLAIDTSGNAYLTGFTGSINFPLTRPLQLQNNGGTWDGFLTKINALGTAASYSTYLGGGGADSGFDVALGANGDAYVLGSTASTNFPTINPFQSANGGGISDLFIARIADAAPNVTVGGRVLTPANLGLRNAIVALTDSQGVRRTATTSSFGVYSFSDVRSGETYTIGVTSKRYRFSSRILTVNDNLTNVDFVGLE